MGVIRSLLWFYAAINLCNADIASKRAKEIVISERNMLLLAVVYSYSLVVIVFVACRSFARARL